MNRTRREFIAHTAAVSAGASLITQIEAAAPPQNPALLKVMDLIIPAGDSMPSSSEAGGMAYLNKVMAKEPAVAAGITRGLTALDGVSQTLFAKPFEQLSKEDAISALTHFEGQDPVQFASLRDYVYESYYTRPAVWRLIGYEFYPTDHPGPRMQPFDDSVLAQVRAMPKHYREDGTTEEAGKDG